jgi:prevent-host-death family protein
MLDLMVPLERRGRVIGIEEARAQLGRLVQELSQDEPIMFTRRGRVVAVLVLPDEYEELLDGRRATARARLQELVPSIRASVAAAGLEETIVDEAIAAARDAEWPAAR